MDWTGDTIVLVNDILKNVDMSGVTDLRVYKNPFLARLEREYSHDNFYTGAGARMSLKSSVPMNARPRADAADVPLPGQHTFTRMTIGLAEYVASTGITIKEQEQAKRSKTAVANLADIKLEDLKDDLRWRLNNAARGDGTGWLGNISAVSGMASPWTLTLDNTLYDDSVATSEWIEPGMYVDILTPAAPNGSSPYTYASGWAYKQRSIKVTSVSGATVVVTADGTTTGGDNSDPAAHDIVVMAGAITIANGAPTFNEMNGLLALIDNGTSKFTATGGSTGTGGRKGRAYFQGLVDRLLIPQMYSTVTSKWNGSSPGSWDLEDILKEIRAIDYGYGGGEVSALYCHPDMQAAIARKAYQANNALVNVTDNKVTGGFYTKQLITSTGRPVPIIPMQGNPLNTIYGVCEDDFKVVMPNDIGFVNPYKPGGGGDTFFAAPGSRNLTYEAWLRCELQVVAERCDNSFRLEGLTTLE